MTLSNIPGADDRWQTRMNTSAQVSRQRGVFSIEMDSGTMRKGGVSYAGPGRKIVIPLQI
jgi:hypothetical protein